jgi:hypothetical protein
MTLSRRVLLALARAPFKEGAHGHNLREAG